MSKEWFQWAQTSASSHTYKKAKFINLKCLGEKKCVLVAQLCPILWDPMDCRPLGSSVHGTLQARILEWVAIHFSRGSSQPRDWTHIAGRFFTTWAKSHHKNTCETGIRFKSHVKWQLEGRNFYEWFGSSGRIRWPRGSRSKWVPLQCHQLVVKFIYALMLLIVFFHSSIWWWW